MVRIINSGGGPSSDCDHEDGGLEKGDVVNTLHLIPSNQIYMGRAYYPQTVLQKSGNISPFIFQTPQKRR